MAKISLISKDLDILNSVYPTLAFAEGDNSISGTLPFDLTYVGTINKRIRGSFNIYFKLETAEGSILPSVFETGGKIINIAKRKGLPIGDLHLNSAEGNLCLILPILEEERYPGGFDLLLFLQHIQEHFYWVAYFDRYNTEPWPGQSHGVEGFDEVYLKNKPLYGPKIIEYYERVFEKCGSDILKQEKLEEIKHKYCS